MNVMLTGSISDEVLGLVEAAVSEETRKPMRQFLDDNGLDYVPDWYADNEESNHISLLAYLFCRDPGSALERSRVPVHIEEARRQDGYGVLSDQLQLVISGDYRNPVFCQDWGTHKNFLASVMLDAGCLDGWWPCE